jgi:putative SOS response-associated peptidase YedK
MCGRFTVRQPEKIKINGVHQADLAGAKPRYNIAPSQQILSVIQTSDERRTGRRERAINPHKKLFTNVSIEIISFGITF